MKVKILIALGFLCLMSGWVHGEDLFMDSPLPAPLERDPSAMIPTSSGKRTYPGGADEEDLQVQARIPDASMKTDAHTLQRDVYKTLYNQELKDERQEAVEE